MDGHQVQWIVDLVARYFRVRAQYPGVGIGVQGTGWSEERYRGVFEQLAADVEHSDLLRRLLEGEEPMPYELWVAREQGVPDLTPEGPAEHSVRVHEEQVAVAVKEQRISEAWVVVIDDESQHTPPAHFVLAVDLGDALMKASDNNLTVLVGKKLYAARLSDMWTPKVKLTISSEGDDQ